MAQKAVTAKKPKASRKKKPEQHEAVAVIASREDGKHHVVGLGNIRVVIVPDGDLFFAQGLEIDYAAQGESIQDVKSNFEEGLTLTIDEHLKIYGDIGHLLRPAPPEVWKEMLYDKAAIFNRFESLTSHEMQHTVIPYEGINYLVAAAA